MTYEDADIVDVVYRKTVVLRDEGAPLDALSCRIAAGLVSRPRIVFDVGGACGASYFRLRPLLTWDLEWHVIETPAMAACARPLEDGRLWCHDGIPDVRPDLVVAAGVIQYLPDPLAFLGRLAGLGAPTIVLTRTATAERVVTMTQRSRLADNGPGPMPAGIRDREVTYPMTAVPAAEIEAVLSGYSLVPFDEPDGAPSPRFGPRVTMRGWLGTTEPPRLP